MVAQAQVEQMRHDFSPNAAHTVRTEIIGREQYPVVVIDDLMRDPQALVEYAATAVEFRPLKRDVNYYPGLRAPVPQDYLASLYTVIKPLMHDVFGLPVDGPLKANCSFSIATSRRNGSICFSVCLISTPSMSGNSRCSTTSAMVRTVERRFIVIARPVTSPSPRSGSPRYLELLKKDIDRMVRRPPQYMRGNDTRFEQIASFEAQFDRVLIYRSQVLHSGSVQRQCRPEHRSAQRPADRECILLRSA